MHLVRRPQWPALLATVVSALIGTLLVAIPAHGASGSTMLSTGESLSVSQRLVSPGGQYTADIADGNLVVSRAGFGYRFRSGSEAADDNATLSVTTGGNLELRTGDGSLRWQTSTSGVGANLVLGDNGNLALVSPSGAHLWSTNTATPQDYTNTVLPSGAALISLDGTSSVSMQQDGNLVVRDSGIVKWSSATRQSGARLVVTPSLGLVVMSVQNRPLWSSRTAVAPASYVSIGDDGNMVVYSNSRPVWQSVVPPPPPVVSCSTIKASVPISDTVVAFNGTRVHKCLQAKYEAMVRAAAKDGVTLAGSGWRDTNRQIQLRIQNCGGSSYYNVYQKPSSQCSPPTAIPGRSMHERGLAIDMTRGSRSINSGDPQFKWLAAHAKEYGLYNLPSENWHWSTTGG